MQAAVRQESRRPSSDPFRAPDHLHDTLWPRTHFRGRALSPLWGGHAQPEGKQAPSRTVAGCSLDSWVLHLAPSWSEEHRHTLAPEVAQTAILAFLAALSMPTAQVPCLPSSAASAVRAHSRSERVRVLG